MKEEKDVAAVLESDEYRRIQNLMIDCWMLLRQIYVARPALPADLERSLANMVDPPIPRDAFGELTELELRRFRTQDEQRAQKDEEWIRLGIPEALLKAASDLFEYSLGLTDGTVIYFEECQLPDRPADFHGWVHLSGVRSHTMPEVDTENGGFREKSAFNFERGLDVRVNQIAWVADAPYGS